MNKSIQKEQGADIWSVDNNKIKQGEQQGAQCIQNWYGGVKSTPTCQISRAHRFYYQIGGSCATFRVTMTKYYKMKLTAIHVYFISERCLNLNSHVPLPELGLTSVGKRDILIWS